MKRVTRTGGWVLALAEPDYGGRIDYPEELSVIGNWQREALRTQGADPIMGRKLLNLFTMIGLNKVQVGVLGGEWNSNWDPSEQKSEWDVFEQDLLSSNLELDQSKINEIRRIDNQAHETGTRITYVPTFYAIGQVI